LSRGIATIIFSKPGSANDALTKLNGLLVDKRPMKVRVPFSSERASS
jgi:THO complex subunit 4